MNLPTKKDAIDYFSNRGNGEVVTDYEAFDNGVLVIVNVRLVGKHIVKIIDQMWEYRNPWRTDDDTHARWWVINSEVKTIRY